MLLPGFLNIQGFCQLACVGLIPGHGQLGPRPMHQHGFQWFPFTVQTAAGPDIPDFHGMAPDSGRPALSAKRGSVNGIVLCLHEFPFFL
jgi:hypothetical protein